MRSSESMRTNIEDTCYIKLWPSWNMKLVMDKKTWELSLGSDDNYTLLNDECDGFLIALHDNFNKYMVMRENLDPDEFIIECKYGMQIYLQGNRSGLKYLDGFGLVHTQEDFNIVFLFFNNIKTFSEQMFKTINKP